MDQRKELNLEDMEQISGGVMRTVNTGVTGLDAALRAEPRKSSRQIDHIPNGAQVDTISGQPVYDSESGRHYVQVTFNGKTGWIASSIINMIR